jgi:transcriptional regulator with XRE-family HTH domain
MEPETPAPPPEARLIRTAREAAGMTAAQAAQATEGGVSAIYWRDVERGYGGRRGQRAPARASDRLLAAMAHVTGVTPDQLAGAQRENAARVLAARLRRASVSPAAEPAPPGADPGPPAKPGSPVEAVLADLLDRYRDDPVVQGIAAKKPRRAARLLVDEIFDWLEFKAAKERPEAGNGTAG